jgi:actin
MKAAIDTRRMLFGNITLAGGSTLFQGIEERLRKEIEIMVPESMSVKIIAPVERINSVWTGGSIIGSMTNYAGMWLTKTDYDEYGGDMLNRFF